MKTFDDWKVTHEFYWDEEISVQIEQVKEYLISRGASNDPVPIEVVLVADLCDLSQWEGADYSPHELEVVDLHVPVILLQDGKRLYLIDGYHRLEVAIRTGVSKLPTVTVQADDLTLYNEVSVKFKRRTRGQELIAEVEAP